MSNLSLFNQNFTSIAFSSCPLPSFLLSLPFFPRLLFTPPSYLHLLPLTTPFLSFPRCCLFTHHPPMRTLFLASLFPPTVSSLPIALSLLSFLLSSSCPLFSFNFLFHVILRSGLPLVPFRASLLFLPLPWVISASPPFPLFHSFLLHLSFFSPFPFSLL